MSWLGLVCTPMTIFKIPGDFGDKWLISISNLGYSAVLAMPVKCFDYGARQFFALDREVSHHDLVFVPIFDLDATLSYEVEWKGPLSKATEKLLVHFDCVLAKAVGRPLTLGQYAAKAAFGTCGTAFLDRLIKHYKLDSPRSPSLWQQLRILIEHFLPGLDNEAHLEILFQRCPPDNDANIDWSSVNVAECVEEGDLEEVTDDQEKLQADQKKHESFQKEFDKLHDVVVATKASAASSSGGTKAKKQKTTPGAGGRQRRPMEPLSHSVLSLQDARLRLAPRWRVQIVQGRAQW